MQTQPIRTASPKKARAYRQAPWRVQTRLLAIGLASIFGLMALLSLFIFAGAQAAEAGLRVQYMIRERDALLRKMESQEGKLARLQSEAYLYKRALELGYAPATKLGFPPPAVNDIDFLNIPAQPVPDLDVVSPTAVLFTEEPVTMPPAYRETLFESLLNLIQSAGKT
jgi:hypothetical protein